MEQHTPYLLTGSGDGPYEIQQGNQAVALLRNTTFEVASHIVKCLNSQPDLLKVAEYTLNHFTATDNPTPDQVKAREVQLVRAVKAAIAGEPLL